MRGEKIRIFDMGDCRRDFTYIDDIVEGVVRVMENPPKVETGADGLPRAAHRVYNIGNSNPENLLDFVDTLQRVLVEEGVLPPGYDFEAHRELVPMQPGDVPVTYADTSALERDTGFRPSTRLEDGLREFARWYRGYYGDYNRGCPMSSPHRTKAVQRELGLEALRILAMLTKDYCAPLQRPRCLARWWHWGAGHAGSAIAFR